MSDARDNIIDLFKKGPYKDNAFPYKDNAFKTKGEKSGSESEEESEENKLEKIKDDYNIFFEYIENESEGINYELFEKHFNFVAPTALAKTLYEIKNKKRNIELVNVIKSRLIDLKYEIEKMSEDEKKP